MKDEKSKVRSQKSEVKSGIMPSPPAPLPLNAGEGSTVLTNELGQNQGLKPLARATERS